MSFGPGDISANDWAFATGIFYTNWSTTGFGSGSLNRVLNIAVRWGAHSGTATARNNIYDGTNLQAYTAQNGVSTVDTGSYNNYAAASTFWLNNATYYGGVGFTSSSALSLPFRDGSGGNYSGKTAGDGDMTGGTNNWAGVGSPGGLGWAATTQNTLIYVFKSSVWTQCFTYVMKSGAWTVCQTSIMKSSVWTALNWLREGNSIPERGLEVMVGDEDGWHRGMLVEAEVGWFGQIDPTGQGLDLSKPGQYSIPYPATFTGRYNHREPEEVAQARMYAHDQWKRAFVNGNERAAAYWSKQFQPDKLPTMRSFGSFDISLKPRNERKIITLGGVANGVSNLLSA